MSILVTVSRLDEETGVVEELDRLTISRIGEKGDAVRVVLGRTARARTRFKRARGLTATPWPMVAAAIKTIAGGEP